MKNKKGFTLVELLAVIAILAVLVIIALPNVLKMFRNAKENTFTSEVQNLVRSAEDKYLTSSMLNGNNTCFDSKTNKLDMTGRDNLIYKIKLTNKGKVIEVSVRDDDYELIVIENNGINRVDIGNKYKVESAKTSITDCNGNEIIGGEKPKVKYAESTLNGADPVLGNGMIPITLSNDGVSTYADEYDKWYSYKDKEWANAVILVDTPSKKYVEGDEILESDIRAYFVWIPKYSYRIFNIGDYDSVLDTKPENQTKEIEIEFGTRTTENDDVKKECASPMVSGESGECYIGDLMTHPAFLSIPSNGFWVGKFEIGYNQNEDVSLSITDENVKTWTKENAEVDEENANKIIVKPNVYSWRSSTIKNFFMSAYNFNRSLDSHMMKNTEWGAVAYLSYSKYGIQDEVRINNNSNSLTGYAAKEKDAVGSETENTAWNTSNGYLASTTGNITGVYDMSGGAWEATSSYVSNYGITNTENKKSGFEEIELDNYKKYFDVYSEYMVYTAFKYRILGDATGELGPFWYNIYNQSTWYEDHSYFPDSVYPWIHRCGYYDDAQTSGQFCFTRSDGKENPNISSRLILSI